MLSNKPKPLLICGSGRTLFPDLEAVCDLTPDYPKTSFVVGRLHDHFDIMAVNDAFLALPVSHYLVSYHDELIWPWQMIRGPLECIYDEHKTQWKGIAYSQRPNKGVKCVKIYEDGGGSSSFFAVQIALETYQRVILCGVPFDGAGRFYQPPWASGHDYAVTDGWEIWERWHSEGKLANVRSMSGRTRDLLGQPEGDWLWQSYSDSMD